LHGRAVVIRRLAAVAVASKPYGCRPADSAGRQFF